MFDTIQLKALELVNRLVDAIDSFRYDERGQTTAEYVAVTAVGVALASVVLWVVLGTAIKSAIGSISSRLTSFVASPPVIP